MDNMGCTAHRRKPRRWIANAAGLTVPSRTTVKSPYSPRTKLSRPAVKRRAGCRHGCPFAADSLQKQQKPEPGRRSDRAAACRYRRRLLLIRCSYSELPEPRPAIDFGADVLREGPLGCSLLQKQRKPRRYRAASGALGPAAMRMARLPPMRR
jgi:hypothetical protein